MTILLVLALDVVAVTILTFALYFPRHRRRELVVAYLGVNAGVLAVTLALAQSAIGAGLGLGLFGVLSIIRLRSTELGQHEVAYYFSALTLGLLGGLAVDPWLSAGLMALVLLVMFVGDHPRLLPRYRAEIVVLDRAFTDRTALVAELEGRLGGRVHEAEVHRLDLVLETTTVQVRYELPPTPRAAASPAPAALSGSVR